MSQTYYGNSGQNNGRGLTFQEEYKLMKKKEATSAWANNCKDPVIVNGIHLRPETIYVGERNMAPTWDEPAFDFGLYRELKSQYKQGKIDNDKLNFSPWIGEWEDLANEAFDNTYRFAGGVATTDDSPGINVINVLGEILGRDTRQYTLENAVTRVATPNLTLSVDTWQGFTASQDVAEGVEAFVKKGKVTRQEFTLKKDVGHIAITDEAQYRADRDLYTMHVQHAVQDMRRLKAVKIATELETATDVAGSDWVAYTGEHSTADPIDQIGTVADLIEANGGTPNTIASHARVFRDFHGNTHINGPPSAKPDLTFGNRVATGIPGLPGFTWYVDNLKTNTLATIFDKRAVLLMQGPTRTAQYRMEGKGIDAYITRDWHSTKIIDATLIRDLTGVSA